jgi:nucleoside-diphosphate-sugar epimerase
MKPKLLVCGATGFVGRNMTEYFAKSGKYDVHAVRFTRPQYECKGVTWHQADLRDPKAVAEVMNGMDIVMQAAATTSGIKDVIARPYIHVTDNAVMNSYLFREAFETKVKHVIFFGCTVIYQSSEKAIKEDDLDESKPLHPRYFGAGNMKLFSEKQCEFFSRISDTKFTAIRHSNMYGAHDKYDLERSHVFGATVTKVMTATDTVNVWGTGDEERDLLYIDDLCAFVAAALEKQKDKFRIYNCGLGKGISIKELVQKMVALSGKKLEIQHDLSQPTIKTSLFLDCTRAKEELGWEPKVTLEEGIKRTLAWWKEHIDPKTLKPLDKKAA